MSTFFIDESKARGYTVVAAIVLPSVVAPLRRCVDELRMRGQRRLHFAKESDQRRRAILSTLQAAQVHGIAYQAHERDDLASRTLCLQAVVADALRLGVTRIVLEQDDSIVSHDRQVLFPVHRTSPGCAGRHHLRTRPRCNRVVIGAAGRDCLGDRARRGLASASEPADRLAAAISLESAKLGPPTVRKAAELTSRRYCTTHA